MSLGNAPLTFASTGSPVTVNHAGRQCVGSLVVIDPSLMPCMRAVPPPCTSAVMPPFGPGPVSGADCPGVSPAGMVKCRVMVFVVASAPSGAVAVPLPSMSVM